MKLLFIIVNCNSIVNLLFRLLKSGVDWSFSSVSHRFRSLSNLFIDRGYLFSIPCQIFIHTYTYACLSFDFKSFNVEEEATALLFSTKNSIYFHLLYSIWVFSLLSSPPFLFFLLPSYPFLLPFSLTFPLLPQTIQTIRDCLVSVHLFI